MLNWYHTKLKIQVQSLLFKFFAICELFMIILNYYGIYNI